MLIFFAVPTRKTTQITVGDAWRLLSSCELKFKRNGSVVSLTEGLIYTMVGWSYCWLPKLKAEVAGDCGGARRISVASLCPTSTLPFKRRSSLDPLS